MQFDKEYEDRFIDLSEQLKCWDSRRRRAEALLWIPRGLLAGLLGAAIIAILMRLNPLVDVLTFILLTCLIAFSSVIAISLTIFSRRRTLLAQARFTDEKSELFDRVSTAVEINSGDLAVIPSLAILQLEDTLQALRVVDRKHSVPLRWNWAGSALSLLVLLLLIGSVLLPNPQSDVLEQRAAVSRSIERQIEKIEEIEQTINESGLLGQLNQEQLLAPMQSAVEALNSKDLNRDQAVAVLSEAEAILRELSATINNDALDQSLLDAGQPLLDNPAGGQFREALEGGNLFGASQATNQLADSLSTMSDEERTDLTEDLAQTAAALKDIDSDLAADIDQTAQSLQSGDIEGAEEALRDAAATLQQRAQEQASAEMAASAATQLDESGRQIAQAGHPAAEDGSEGNQASAEQGQGQDGREGNGQGQGVDSSTTGGSGQVPGGTGPGGGRAESVFVPAPLDLNSGEGIDVELPAECVGDPDGCGSLLNESLVEFGDEESLIPYQQVFADYRDSAFEALEGDYVPIGLKGYVREYFTTLEP